MTSRGSSHDPRAPFEPATLGDIVVIAMYHALNESKGVRDVVKLRLSAADTNLLTVEKKGDVLWLACAIVPLKRTKDPESATLPVASGSRKAVPPQPASDRPGMACIRLVNRV